MITRAQGVALHYFDGQPGANGKAAHDKFYRMYLYPSAGGFAVTSNWGRDNPGVTGQSKTEYFATFGQAQKYLDKLADSKRGKGYDYLGTATVNLDTTNMARTGEQLVRATGKTPNKTGVFTAMIFEEEDIFDLLGIARET